MGEVERLEAWMGRMEDKQDDILTRLGRVESQWAIRPCTDHETRIRSVEQFRWMSLGIVGMLSAAPGIIALMVLFGG